MISCFESTGVFIVNVCHFLILFTADFTAVCGSEFFKHYLLVMDCLITEFEANSQISFIMTEFIMLLSSSSIYWLWFASSQSFDGNPQIFQEVYAGLSFKSLANSF